jgi:hypothetical protein
LRTSELANVDEAVSKQAASVRFPPHRMSLPGALETPRCSNIRQIP